MTRKRLDVFDGNAARSQASANDWAVFGVFSWPDGFSVLSATSCESARNSFSTKRYAANPGWVFQTWLAGQIAVTSSFA